MNCTDKVRDWINENGLISRGDHVTAAVSGGPDSMAMLSILHNLSSELGFTLSAASFDHRIRKYSGKDLKEVEIFCSRLGVSLMTGGADVPALAEKNGTGLEETARDARYSFLEKADGLIALGHHRDDQVETVLHNVLRGAGLRGLSGMPVRRGRLIRPMMCCGVADLLRYCRENDIPHVYDHTNEDLAFLRNRIRHSLLPKIREHYNPSVDEAMLRLAANARDGLEALKEGITSLVPEKAGDGSVTVDAVEAGALADYHLYLLVDSILRERLGIFRDMTRKHFEAVYAIIRTGQSGRRLTLPHGVTVTLEHGSVRFDPASASAPAVIPETVILPGDGVYRIPGRGITVSIETVDREPEETGKTTEHSVVIAPVTYPVIVRARKEGDRIVPFGMQGRKKLSDIMIDAKVPARLRDLIPILENADGILWVQGLVTSERTRITGAHRKITSISITS